MIRAIIVDDEENLRKGLNTFLNKYCPEVNVLAQADSVRSALEAIKKHEPDLLFLDIQLSDGTGFDILEKIAATNQGEINLHTIFITAFDQYAVKAFKFSALDYLLKPIDPEELKEAVNKVKEKVPQKNLSDPLELLLENLRSSTVHTKRIALASSEGIHMFNISDIIRCESLDNYTRFYLNNHKPILVSKTLNTKRGLFISNPLFIFLYSNIR